jgi:hypothetical protein
MEVRIQRRAETVIFEFRPKPFGFFKLSVASRTERMWGLVPMMAETVHVIEADMIAVRGSRELVTAVTQTLEETAGSRLVYPPLSGIVYGQVPEGYRETMKARLLVRGEEYCVLVHGQGFDTTRGYFLV